MSMKGNVKIRESNGRIMGKLDYTYIHNDEESYQDHKIKSINIRFPMHNQYDASPVTISYINKN